jgi:thiamine-monophosphate kinase
VGLLSLEAAKSNPAALGENAYPAAHAAHLRPQPLIELGQTLALSGVNALMDVSEGLDRGLPRLLGREQESGLGAEIEISPQALHPEVLAFARAHDLDPVREAFLGGEDYLLLGACAESVLHRLSDQGKDVLFLGTITTGPDIVVNGQAWNMAGFDHFG